MYINFSLNEGVGSFSCTHSASFHLTLREFTHVSTIYIDYLVISHHSSKICLDLSEQKNISTFGGSLRVCRLHVYLFNLSVIA